MFKVQGSRTQCERPLIVLGVASVWSKSKGLYDFIELSQNPGIVVVLVGVSDEIKKELPDRIVAIGRTQDQHELAMLYSMADAFVNPTYADMFPTVNLEALACGTQVITYRTGGSPEAVTPETGWVVEQGDVEGVAAIAQRLKIKDQSEIETQREACRKRAEEEFDKNKCFEKYLALYEQIKG